LNDGDEKDQPEKLCVNVVNDLPRCMAMIEPSDVIRRIELYFENGMADYLTRSQAREARPFNRLSQRELLLPFSARSSERNGVKRKSQSIP
jgi:hypothetical protein